MDWKTLFFSPAGRIGQQAFWIAWLCLFGVHVVVGWIPLLGWALALVAVYCSVCVYAKRLHDMGYSGWWQLIMYLLGPVLVIGVLISTGVSVALTAISGADPEWAALVGMGGFMISLGVAFVAWVAFTLWVGLSPPQAGDNRYGAPPPEPMVF